MNDYNNISETLHGYYQSRGPSVSNRYEEFFAFCASKDSSLIDPNFVNNLVVRNHVQMRSSELQERFRDFSFKYSNGFMEISFARQSEVKEEAVQELNRIIVFIAEMMDAEKALKTRHNISLILSFHSPVRNFQVNFTSALEVMKYLMREKRLVHASKEKCMKSRMAS